MLDADAAKALIDARVEVLGLVWEFAELSEDGLLLVDRAMQLPALPAETDYVYSHLNLAMNASHRHARKRRRCMGEAVRALKRITPEMTEEDITFVTFVTEYIGRKVLPREFGRRVH